MPSTRGPARLVGGGLVALSLVLTGCGKGGDAPAPGSAVPAAEGRAAKAPAGEVAVTQKMNAYTEAYNKLIGTFGLAETRDRYFKEEILRQKPTDSISITDGWVEQGLDAFRKARALPGNDLPEIDKAADALIAPLTKVVAQLKDLSIYYESKAYKEDALAKGKAADPLLRADFDAAIAAADAFSDVLGREEKKRNLALLEQLKKRGELLAYQTKLALMEAQELVELFDSPAQVKDAAQYAKADAVVGRLEKTLAEQRKEYAAAQSKPEKPDTDHDQVTSYLTSLVGGYRELKQSKDPKDVDRMVERYNDAIKYANDITY